MIFPHVRGVLVQTDPRVHLLVIMEQCLPNLTVVQASGSFTRGKNTRLKRQMRINWSLHLCGYFVEIKVLIQTDLILQMQFLMEFTFIR